MADEPRIGRKLFFFALLGGVIAIFMPLLGVFIILLLALSWLALVLIWIVTAAQVRRPILYITAFTVAFILVLILLGRLNINIVPAH